MQPTLPSIIVIFLKPVQRISPLRLLCLFAAGASVLTPFVPSARGACSYIGGDYSIVERVNVRITLLDSGEVLPCSAIITGTIPLNQSVCSLTLSDSGASITGCDGVDYTKTRSGSINGSQITLNGTLYRPLPSSYRPAKESSTATGTVSGNRITLSGSGSVEFFGTFGDTRITWTSTVTLDKILDLPIILVQPTNRTVYVGATVSFAVGATHNKPFSYQWRRNGVNLSGETKPVLAMQNVSAAEAGTYSVVLSNYSGLVTSASAQLKVNPLPAAGAPWVEGWQKAVLGVHYPTTNLATVLSADKGSWFIGDTVSGDCSPVENWAEIISHGGNNMLKLYSATNSNCALNIWVDFNKTLNPGFSLPLLPKTEISFFEQGWMEDPQWNGFFPTVILPPADTVNLQVVDNRTNVVVYIFQRAPNYVEHALTNGPSSFGYLEVFLDLAGGKFTRNLYADFARIAGVAGVGEYIESIEFGLASPGWAVLDDLKIGRELTDQLAPTLAITNPSPSGVRVSTAIVDLKGWARDNDRVTNVAVSVNGAAYVPATLLNNGTNWVLAGQALVPGTNSVQAYAQDANGNVSTVVSSRVVYVVSDQLTLQVNPPGGGTVSGVVNGQWLEIGRSYTATAMANTARSYGFTQWLRSTNGLDWATSTLPVLTFTAQSNLVLIANFVDIQKPVVTITAPTLNQRWSNAVFTVAGKASDNGQVAQLVYQLNGGDWISASTANAWSNWTASVTLTPGPNTVRAYAVDATGNRSITNAVTMTYVLSGPLVVGINGKGTVMPNYNGKLLEIGKVHTMTATPAVGYAFSNWTDAVGMVITNKTLLSFVMQSNLVFNANFGDIQKPVVTITAPTLNQRWSNAVFTVAGKASDNGQVAQLVYQLNGGDWTSASTANAWSNWTASVTLTPGPNTVRAYAVDATGNRSITNTVTMTYVLSRPLVVGINGKGTVTPNYHGKLLEIGKPHSMTATPAVGYAFSNWTDAVGMVITNKTMLSFIMQSNLVFNANFGDIQKPTVTITAPTLNQRWSNAVFTVAGKATDNGQVAQVVYQLNGGDWTSTATANAWSNWTASVTLTPGPNTVRAYAVDATGNRSTTNTVNMTHVLSGPLVVGINGKGTVAPNYNGKLLEIGKPHSMTATPAVGYAFTNWTGSITTNKALLSFIMQSNLTFMANFVDIQKPTVTITAPTLNQRWSNAVFTVAGKAADNGAVAQVLYQLNSGDWISAATANNWSNWTASVTLTPGPNTVRAYALDATGNCSLTNTVSMTYVMTYALVDYFHPLSVGNEWVYRFTHHSPTPTNSVIRVDSVSHPLTCYRGRTVPTSYVTNVISLYSSYCDYHNGAEVFVEDTWYEYYTANGGLRMWGSDDDPGTIPDPDQERLRVDGGVLLGERLAVGQTISSTRDLYEDGKFIGAAAFSAQLVAQTSVTVPAGTFPECLHIRVTFSINGAPSSFEEWWAKGIGMVKKTRTSSGGYPQLYELSQFTIANPAAPAPPVGVTGQSEPLLALQLERIDQQVSTISGCLLLRLSGPAGSSVVVESSSDLLNWTPVTTNAIPGDGLKLTMPVDQFPQQFFRARLR